MGNGITLQYLHYHVSSFDDYFTTPQKDRYNLMCSIETYEKLHPTYNGDANSGGNRPLPYGSTLDTLKSLGDTLNFIDFWLQSFEANYYQRKMMYKEKVSDFLRRFL